MGIVGAIPSAEELVTNNTLLDGEVWTTAPSGVVPLATAAGADNFGNWVQVLAAGTWIAQFVSFCKLLPVVLANDATYEVEFGYGLIGAPVSLTVVRFRRTTSGGITMMPLAPIEVKSPRVVNAAAVGFFVRARCSVAGPVNLDVQVAYRLYPVGV